jgi:phage tail P2-like protein
MIDNKKSLLPINASDLLKDLEYSGSKIMDLKTSNKLVFNPDLAPENILPWIGWGLSIDAWSDNWPLETKRKMIRNSLILHKIKGTKAAIKKALEIIGVLAEITEWWETNPKLTPHTFQLVAYLNDNLDQNSKIIITEATQKKLINLINNVKPLRSHLDFKLGINFSSILCYQATFRVKNYLEFSLQTRFPKFSNNLTITMLFKITTYQEING